MAAREWDDEFDKEFFTPEEIAESDARTQAITEEIKKQTGHGSMLPFGREAVDK